MTTNINIKVSDPHLISINKIDIAQNRDTHVLGEEQTSLQQKAAAKRQTQLAAQGKRPDGSSKTGGSKRSPLEREKPAAFRFPDLISISHYWYDPYLTDTTDVTGYGFSDGTFTSGTSDDGGSWVQLTKSISISSFTELVIKDIISGDGRVTTQLRSPSQARTTTSSTYGSRILVLPVSQVAFILIATGYRYSSNFNGSAIFRAGFAPGSQAWSENYTRSYIQSNPTALRFTSVGTADGSVQRFANAYLCTLKGAREIPLPAKLEPILDFINPAPRQSTNAITVYPNYPANFDNSYVATYPSYTGVYPSLASGDPICDPRVFNDINRVAFDAGMAPLIDTGTPNYKLYFFRDFTRFGDSNTWLYAYKTNITDDEAGSQMATKYDYRYARSITEPPDFDPSHPWRREHIPVSTLGVNSSYCIAMCRALGFSDTDLKP